jgi:hypothetical protein
MSRDSSKWVERRFVVRDIKVSTEKAILVVVGDREGWIAKSQLKGPEPRRPGDILVIAQWLADEKGFTGARAGGKLEKQESENAHRAFVIERVKKAIDAERTAVAAALEEGGVAETAYSEGRRDALLDMLEVILGVEVERGEEETSLPSPAREEEPSTHASRTEEKVFDDDDIPF